ncbi:MAG: GntR family transcriptional regulator, partial [Deinococcus sp.]|nr:GntR family transcriptional regulator [Deinococcus sp.]
MARDSVIPLYYQLKELLRERIEAGEWEPGNQIPTEEELCERYKVSRITVREAIQGLVSEGLLYRQQGRGTFVAKAKIQQGLQRLTSFTEDMQLR